MSDFYQVLIARPVIEDLAGMSSRVQNRFFNAIDLLQRFPEIGHDYEAEPDEDELLFPCREYHLPDTFKTIYYTLDEVSRAVKVFALIDQRRNSTYRFRGIDKSRLDDL